MEVLYSIAPKVVRTKVRMSCFVKYVCVVFKACNGCDVMLLRDLLPFDGALIWQWHHTNNTSSTTDHGLFIEM